MARKRSPAPFVFRRIRNDEVPIEQAFDKDSLEPLDGHADKRSPKGVACCNYSEALTPSLARSNLPERMVAACMTGLRAGPYGGA
jgi:hypothetical protein